MLTFLKYAGLIIAAASSIWGTTTNLTEERDGNKRLTRAGYAAIAFMLLGLFISIGSNVLEDRQKSTERDEALKAEIRRTNRIIVSGQPLTSLDLRWEFQGVNKPLQEVMKHAGEQVASFYDNVQGRDVSGQEANEINRTEELYPFLLSLSKEFAPDEAGSQDKKPNPNILVLIALDEAQNSVLPFGRLDSSITWGLRISDFLLHKQAMLAGGVSFCENYSCAGGEPYAHVTRELGSWPSIERVKSRPADAFAIRWSLDPMTFANAVEKQNSFIVPTARLPIVLKIAVLFSIHDLPFKSANFALPFTYTLWTQPDSTSGGNFTLATHTVWGGQERRSGENTSQGAAFSSSIVRLIANNMPEAAYTYRLKIVTQKPLLDDYDEETNSRCLFFEFEML